MYLNQFSVNVLGGREVRDGYVEITHGQIYSLRLRNDRSVRCDARVEIDGKDVGTFRLNAHSGFALERPLNDEGHFTAYRPGTAGVTSGPDLGLIRVTFTPEKPPVHHVYRSSCDIVGERAIPQASLTMASAYSGIGTGLSGHSDQQFHSVAALDYDYAQQTVIHLRLVEADSGPRPLISVSNPVPPRIV